MNTFSLTICDQSGPRSEAVDQILKLAEAPISARMLIAARVRLECDPKTTTADRWSYLLVSPSARERVLNGMLTGSTDTEKEVERALKAFKNNDFILLVDDFQVETLDQPLTLTPETVVTFLKLTPLVGG